MSAKPQAPDDRKEARLAKAAARRPFRRALLSLGLGPVAARRMGGLEQRMEQRFDVLEENIASVDRKVDQLRKDTTDMFDRVLDEIGKVSKEHDQRISRIEERLGLPHPE